MIITNQKTGDTIKIKNAYTGTDFKLDNLEFFDGTLATIDYTNVSLTITYQPEVIEESINVDETTDEMASALSEICSTDSITDTTSNTVEETNALSVATSDSTEQATDTQALLLIQELSGSDTDNNVFTSDTTENTDSTAVFTEQYTVVE